MTACIVGEKLIERSKDALDNIYDPSADSAAEANSQFAIYGSDKLKQEIKYCIELVDKIVGAGDSRTLRSLIFENKTTNAFPTVFSTIFLALHELSFGEQLVLADPEGAHKSLSNVHGRLNTRRDALGPEKRRDNINTVKGLLRDKFVTGDVSSAAFGARRELDIENTLRRSQIETPSFELKQGLLRLDAERAKDENVTTKVLQAICAIANIGPRSNGAVFVGVADNESDKERIEEIDRIEAKQVGTRWIVGIDREAKALSMTPEKYYQLWRDAINKSGLSEALKADVLSNLDLCMFRGMHVMIIAVPAQKSVSLLDGKVYTRDGDQTAEASPEKIVGISARFPS
jgi:hypothetical protein